MSNVKHEIKGTNLIITVDISQPGERSGSGKSMLIGSTKGFQSVDGSDFKMNVNVIKPTS